MQTNEESYNDVHDPARRLLRYANELDAIQRKLYDTNYFSREEERAAAQARFDIQTAIFTLKIGAQARRGETV